MLIDVGRMRDGIIFVDKLISNVLYKGNITVAMVLLYYVLAFLAPFK